jgi:serine/threonine protein kinase
MNPAVGSTAKVILTEQNVRKGTDGSQQSTDPLKNEKFINTHLPIHEHIARGECTETWISLEDKVKRKPPLEECEVLRILYQIARGLAALHENRIEHMNITAKNILLIGETNNVKICNFAEAKENDLDKVEDMKKLGDLIGMMYTNPKKKAFVSKWVALCRGDRERKDATQVSEAIKKRMEDNGWGDLVCCKKN